MILTPADLSQLKAFISKRGFTEPDLQMEIIDHMACRVEELMTANRLLSLNEAIGLAHSEFGIMGFSVFEDAMRTALQKRYWRLFRQFYLANFTWKTVPLMAGIIYLCNIIFQAINSPETVFNITGLIIFGGLVVHGQVNSARFKRYNKMLTFKMGSVFLIISCVLFQTYNLLIIQLELYKHIAANMLGLLYGSILLLLLVTVYAINQTQQHAVNSCKGLEAKYKLMSV